jgi:hypothetical protein
MADCEDHVQYSASASRTDRNPTFLIALGLVLEKNMVSGQNIFSVRATDTVFRKMLFIVFVPVELAGFSHSIQVYIKCTYTANAVRGDLASHVIHDGAWFLVEGIFLPTCVSPFGWNIILF